jgi:N-methylhydantoinase A
LLLGRLDAESFLGGSVPLHRDRAENLLREQKGVLGSMEEFCAGILRVVETEMDKAIRVISVEQGYDPRDFTLVAFGGGGPVHACSLARALRIPTVLVPAMPGALSALGILLADVVRDHARTVMLAGDAIGTLEPMFEELEERTLREFAEEGLVGSAEYSVDLRYAGQGYELNVPWNRAAPADSMAAFHQLHRQRYGFCDERKAIQIVNLRLRMTAAGEPYVPQRRELTPGDGSKACYAERPVYFDGKFVPSRLYHREQLVPGDVVHGPAMITEYTSATVLPPDCGAAVDGLGNLVIAIGVGA